ncbi:MAG TPA: hypothetical protein VMW42_08415 [Desulfatiglandales bacterium]|nr:hypothetical protein [Desulfatiglandales bacterium]
MKPEKLTLTMHVGIEITLWQAIKLRIAGKHLREYLERMLKECLNKPEENKPEWDRTGD